MPHARERRLPSGALEVVINLREDGLRVYDWKDSARIQDYGRCVVIGAHSTFFVIDTANQAALMGICFKPGGAAPFFSLPIDELHDSQVPLEILWGKRADELRERLLAVTDAQARLWALEQFLCAQALRPLLSHPVISFALAKLQPSDRSWTIAELTREIGYSARHFSQMFSAHVGLTPKQFYRVRRFQEVLHQIEDGHLVVWAEFAANTGYFDQAHFIHDFRAFCGLTPGAYLAQRGVFRNHLPLTT